VYCHLHCLGGRQRGERIPGYLSRLACLPLLARVRVLLVELYFIISGLNFCVIVFLLRDRWKSYDQGGEARVHEGFTRIYFFHFPIACQRGQFVNIKISFLRVVFELC
jgi:hypothetical protein